ncbi:Bacterial sugar transferase [Anoxybacillus sp. BCO1]|nr:Bacterial sugar transferase [Anoxybacillus sp. BCO1]
MSGRNDLGFRDMVELDLQYIRERSFLYDLKIIVKTIVIMIKPNGAY